jgi:hypothetical protein
MLEHVFDYFLVLADASAAMRRDTVVALIGLHVLGERHWGGLGG